MRNIHPLVVHFPIACLVIYTIVEVVSFMFPRWKDKLLLTKQLLLWVGVVSAWMALQTGEIAADIIDTAGGREPAALDAHEEFGEMAYRVYGLLAVWYLVQAVAHKWWVNAPLWLIDLMNKRWVHLLVCLVAVWGSILLMITGALGGSMVYGPDVDPMVRLIYDLVID